MKRVPVSSSEIASIGHDPKTLTLEVEFHSGGVYQYFDVSSKVHQALMSAESHGKFLNAHIKGHYRYAKV
jgi:hypothetical protein